MNAICARLDGLPLAIELAADRARLLPLPALLERLEHRLELLSCGPRDLPERQRSLRATLEWSWEALHAEQRALLAQLSVFEGGATLEACHVICDTDGCPPRCCSRGSWTRRRWSSSRQGEDAQPRLAMLDSVREFAADQVSDLADLERRHAALLPRLRRARRRRGARPPRVARPTRARAREPAGRVRAPAARRASQRTRCGSRSPSPARCPWDAHAHEVRGWLAQALEAIPPEPSPLRAAALYWDGQLALSQARFAAAEEPLSQALDAARALGDRALEAAAWTVARAPRGAHRRSRGARALCEAAVEAARGVGDPGLIADALLASAGACERAEDWERAARLADEALALYREAGDLYGVAEALGEQGYYDLVHGRLERAEQRLERGARAAPPARRRPPRSSSR